MINYTPTRNKVSLDDVCKLISVTFEEDDVGNQISNQVEREVFCKELPVYSGEFYKASQQNIKLQKIFVIDKEEYSQEELIEHNEVIYDIFRTFIRNDGFLEIYCSEKVGV